MSEVNLSDEQRVRAVYPKAYFDYPGNSLVRIRQGVYPNHAIGDGCDISNAWAAALHHPTIQAYERTHRSEPLKDMTYPVRCNYARCHDVLHTPIELDEHITEEHLVEAVWFFAEHHATTVSEEARNG